MLGPKQVWAIRLWLDQRRRLRDGALIDFAGDNKLRGCDIVGAVDRWAYENGVTLDFSRPGKPTDNAFVENFNGRLCDECLVPVADRRSGQDRSLATGL